VKDLKWPAVVVIMVLMVTLGFLAYHDKDVTAVLAGIMAVLSALGFGYTYSQQRELQGQQNEIKSNTETIKDQTNGNIGQLTQMLDQQARDHRREMSALADKLAGMMPASSEPTSGAGVYAETKGTGHPSDL
jgi:cell division protein FtsB